MHSAAIYQLKDRLLVHPWQRTTMGLGIASEPYVGLPLDVDLTALGNCALAALAQSGKTVTHPLSWKGLNEPRLRAAGVKSERAFQTSSRNLTIERVDDALRIEPSRNGGAKGDAKGFEPLPELGTTLPLSSAPEAIGSAIRAALAKCS